MRLALGALAAAALVLGAPAAQAAQRFAAPEGSGGACTQQFPCQLSEAINKSAANDEVIVGTGTYSVEATLFPPGGADNVHIHGDFSGPMPKIEGTGTGAIPIGMSANGGHISYLEIVNNGVAPSAAGCNPGGLLDRVRLTAIGDEATGLVQRGDCTVRDSVIRADGANSLALEAYGFSPLAARGLVRNVTAIATGSESTGIDAEYTEFMNPSSYTLDVKNSMVAGEASDLDARVGLGGPGNIEVSNSNFDVATATAPATITGEANQAAPPVFVDAANGDYREAASSPTIDAGSADQIGALDLAGNSRVLGAAPDIGAFEFVPAPPPPPPPASIESLAVSPRTFRARSAGEAITSRTHKQRAPAGTTVTYALSAAGSVSFTVERAIKGRRVGKKCVKHTRANRTHKGCVFFRKRGRGFSHAGVAGENKFKFSGRINGRALTPGRYRLAGTLGESIKRAAFKIVR